MVNLKFKIGDVVRLVNVDKTYPNWRNVEGEVAQIKQIGFLEQKYPYVVKFFRKVKGTNENCGVIYAKHEMEKLSEREALAWLI
ncbi:MAG: hypothetical protein IMZ52_02815 [Actinobacteria bacterium]|nr:hypothetical protein [Actinomycetota bacterium]MBE3114849.1 hypothetical protein [Actinomycetota bacterium]